MCTRCALVRVDEVTEILQTGAFFDRAYSSCQLCEYIAKMIMEVEPVFDLQMMKPSEILAAL